MMKSFPIAWLVLCIAFFEDNAFAQVRLEAPVLDAERTVTLRLHAPEARAVSVTGELGPSTAMEKDAEGIWSVRVGPLEPDIYGYSFDVDGLRIADPNNPWLKPAQSANTSAVHIPAEPPHSWDQPAAEKDRGSVHLHEYVSRQLGSLRRFRVYTPAHDPADSADLPLLCLFHGSGDNEATWTDFGRAHVILDHLIAKGQARRMIVVMTDGHPHGMVNRGDTEKRALAMAAFETELMQEVLPFVEANYRVAKERNQRAIAGLSMGAGHAVTVGLRHLTQFAWVGSFSGGDSSSVLMQDNLSADLASHPLNLFWVAIGRDDYLLEQNRQFHDNLESKGIEHEWQITDGGHQWRVWRRYLGEFATRLFK